MGTFQPNRRRNQPPITEPKTRALSTENSRRSKPKPTSLPRTLTPVLVSQPTPRPVFRSTPLPSNVEHQISTTFRTPRITSYPNISRLPHAVEAIYEFDKLINFLLDQRPQVAERFITECWEFYKKNYKGNQKNITDPSLPVSSSRHPRQHRQSDDHLSSTQAKQLIPDDQLTHDPDVIIVSDSTELTAPNPPGDQLSTRTLPNGLARDLLPPPSAHCDRAISLTKGGSRWESPLLARQSHLEKLVYERWRSFVSAQGRSTQHSPTDDQKYVVWGHSARRKGPIILDAKSCCMALLDAESRLSDVHLRALRFLWCHLIENTCTGAVFNHGIGYPRTHIIYLFAQLVISSPDCEKSRILIVCPPSSFSQWEMSSEPFENIGIEFLTMSHWQENVNQWRARGGVLIATDETYYNIVMQPRSPDKRAALAALCSPGPDICILDEASRTNTAHSKPLFRRLLNRTRTRSRLALTSLPLAGYITRTWSILDWACPHLFGTRIEYHCNFVDPIVKGHKRKATLHDAKVSFSKACLLHNRMGMVTFTVDPRMRREALLTKGLTLHESVIWVNLNGEEYAIYRDVELFLSKAVEQRQLSPFIASDLLICAASSVHALQRTLRTWGGANAGYLEAIGHYDTFAQHQESLRDLLRIVETRLREGLICTKMQLTAFVGRQCLLRRERLVIFASSQELFEEVHDFLRSRLDHAKVHTYDAALSVKRRSESLDQFNTAQDGAILVAPYGPTFHCMEESGWGFVNATRVLFIDSSWHSGASVQAVNRVHNFAQLSSEAHVHHFLARGTVEQALSSVLEWRYKHMSDCDSSTLPEAMSSDLDDRGFLLAPEVSPCWIRPNPPAELPRTVSPVITRMNLGEHEKTPGSSEHEDMILPLQTTQDTSNGERFVHEIILNSDRYRSLTENLDLWMRSEWSGKTRFLVESEDNLGCKKTVQAHRESLHTLGGDMVHELNSCGDIGCWLAWDGTFTEDDSDVCHLLSSWEPYHRLYERSVPITSLPKLNERRDKRSRQRTSETDASPKRQRLVAE